MIEGILNMASLAAALAGLIVLIASVATGKYWRVGIPMTLDLWTAATLLGLAGDSSWLRLAATASISGIQGLMFLGRRREFVETARTVWRRR